MVVMDYLNNLSPETLENAYYAGMFLFGAALTYKGVLKQRGTEMMAGPLMQGLAIGVLAEYARENLHLLSQVDPLAGPVSCFLGASAGFVARGYKMRNSTEF
jgi:hypothetical protein